MESVGRRAGVVGLGQIGGGVAVCLARAGRALSVYDVRPDAAARRPELPALAESPEAVARASDVVFIAVVDFRQVEEVLFGAGGLLSGARPGLVVVLLSTLDLDEVELLQRTLDTAGVRLLDCGVTGGPLAAEKGLVCLLGGDDPTVAEVMPVLEDMSAQVFHMGPVGAGMRAKVARNITAYVQWRAVYETALLAEAAGVDLHKLAQAMQLSHPSPEVMTAWLGRGTVRPLDAAEAHARDASEQVLRLLRKDLGAALALGRRLGVDLPAAQTAYDGGAEIFGLAGEPPHRASTSP